MDKWQIIDLLLRGIAIGAQLGLGLALARSADDRGLRLATLLFVVSNICFTINGFHPLARLLGSFQMVLWFIQIGGAGYFWLFAVTLFEDRRLDATSMAPAVALTIIGLLGQFGPFWLKSSVWTGHNILGLVLALHALLVILRSGSNDLIEARRKLRVPFLLLVAAFSIILSIVQIGQIMGINAGWYELANAGVQAVLGVAGVAALLEARAVLFGAAVQSSPPRFEIKEVDDTAYWLDRLRQAMEVEALWRREGLTIGEVAKAIGSPEHRLRRLINDQLGHRNFTAYVNQHRIENAKALLADPAQSNRNVANIAFDLGFGSIGPFNRAFRDATGRTPTEYRRESRRQS